METPDRRRAALRPGKGSARSSKKRAPARPGPDSYCVHDPDRDIMYVISGECSEERRVVKRSRRAEQPVAAITVDSGWGSAMPVEILRAIFKLLADTEGAVPILCRLSQVCHRWNQVAADPALWRRVSLSHCWRLPVKTTPLSVRTKIQKTADVLMRSRLSLLSDFSLHHWRHLVPFILQSLSGRCQLLTSLTLSHCERVTTSDLLSVASGCPQLQALSLQQCTVESFAVCRFLEVTGTRLRSLRFSFNQQMKNIMKLLTNGVCPELRVLEISSVVAEFSNTVFQLSIETFQASCPKLEVLRFLNLSLSSTSESHGPVAPTGFRELRELCLATTSASLVRDSDFQRLLRDATKLRILDIRGCRNLTPAGIAQLPCPDLQCLYFGMYHSTSFITSGSVACGSSLLTRRWRHSLQELDLTSQTYSEQDLAQALELLCRDGCNDTLCSLNLTATRVTSQSVRHLLSSCQKITYLNLASCRNIPRGLKRVYRGVEEVRECLSNLVTKHQEETDQ